MGQRLINNIVGLSWRKVATLCVHSLFLLVCFGLFLGALARMRKRYEE